MTSTDEMNSAIAEILGKKAEWVTERVGMYSKDSDGGFVGGIHEIATLKPAPNYCEDLNAMAEAEKVLNFDQCFDFDKHLAEIPELAFTCFATARQRAEAFLKTVAPK